MSKPTTKNSLDYLVAQMPSAIAYINTSMQFVHLSEKWLQCFQLTRSKCIGNEIANIFNKGNDAWCEYVEKCLENYSEYGFRAEMGQSQTEKWIDFTISPWLGEENEILGVIVAANDISKLVENEALVLRMDKLLLATTEISKVGIWDFNVIEQKLKWSETTKIIHEVSKDYVPDVETAIDFYKIGHDRNTIAMLVHNAMDKGQEFDEKLQIVTNKGNEKWVRAAGKPYYRNGQLISITGTLQDITEQVLTETKLKEAESMLRTLIDNLPLNVYVKDLESRKVLVNKSECEFLGVEDHNELIGKSNYDLFDKKTADQLTQDDIRVMRNQTPVLNAEVVLEKYDGSKIPFLVSKIPLVDEDNKTYGLLGISVDISDLKQKEEELKNLINITSIQNKKLLDFTHIISHNLRSHTANFSMLLEFLSKEDDEDEKNRIMKMLFSSSNGLTETLANLTDVLQVRDKIKLENEQVLLNGLVDKTLAELSGIIGENNVIIENSVPKETSVYGVKEYISNIVINFITNAVKYSDPERQPKISINLEQKKNKIFLNVADNGLGIDLEKHGDKLFGMYKTFHNNKNAKGIGLYICKNQAEAMKCDIEVKSKPGIGSTFTLVFNG